RLRVTASWPPLPYTTLFRSSLEPGVLVGGVVDDQFGDHPQPALVSLGNEALGIGHVAVVRMHAAILGNVIAIVAPRRGVERQQPDRVDAQGGDIVELLDQAGKITDAIVVGIEEGFHVNLIDHRILVPEWIFDKGGRLARFGHVLRFLKASTAADATAKPAL